MLPWLYGVARLVLANEFRRARRAERLALRVATLADGAPADDPADIAERLALAEVFDRLPERDREVLRLVAWEQLTTAEVAVVLGCRRTTAAMRLARAGRRLLRGAGPRPRHPRSALMRTRVRELLGPLDPMRGEPVVEPPPMSFPREVKRRSGLVVAAVALVVVVVGMVVWPDPPRGAAATPQLLRIVAPATPTSSGERLLELAGRARASGVPATGGTTEYLELRAWYLHGQVSGGGTVSAVVPEIHRTWLAADGSGRAEKEWAEPEFPADGEWAFPLSGTETREWDGQTPTDRPPTTADGMARYLHRPNPPDHIGPIKTVVAIRDLLNDRVLAPAERAAVLELLARLPGTTYLGRTTDRIGRAAEAFAMDSDYGGLPVRHTLLVAPDTGVFLGYEEMLTTTPGKLNVTVPAVIAYETYARAEFR